MTHITRALAALHTSEEARNRNAGRLINFRLPPNELLRATHSATTNANVEIPKRLPALIGALLPRTTLSLLYWKPVSWFQSAIREYNFRRLQTTTTHRNRPVLASSRRQCSIASQFQVVNYVLASSRDDWKWWCTRVTPRKTRPS